jgi:hypothetical protein
MKLSDKKFGFGIGFGFSVLAAAVLFASTACAGGSDRDPKGPPAELLKKSKTEEKAVATSAPGANVRGESGDFKSYLNDDLFPTDEEVRLMDVDDNSRVVLGGAEDTAGVAYKKSYEKSPIAE